MGFLDLARPHAGCFQAGSRTIIGIGGTLFVLNMLIPDPLPLVDEFLILAGTILLSRMAKTGEAGATGATGASEQVRRVQRCEPGEPKPVGRGSTQTRTRSSVALAEPSCSDTADPNSSPGV